MDEVHYYKAEEFLVVELTNAVVEPFAVVVELRDAFVACAAVLGFGADIGVADSTEIFE